MHRFAALLCAGCLAAAGCGDDEEPADEATSPPAEAPAPTDTTAPAEEEEQQQEAPPAADHEGGPGRAAACGDLPYEPNTDAGAFGIRTTGASCELARQVAAAAEGADGVRYEEEGFTCSAAPRGGRLPTLEWSCTRGAAQITFSTS